MWRTATYGFLMFVLMFLPMASSAALAPDRPDKVAAATGQLSKDQGSAHETSALSSHIGAVLSLRESPVRADELAKTLMGSSKPAGSREVFVLDTRSRGAFDQGHIPGAVNIPLRQLPSELLSGRAKIPPDADVVVASRYGGDGAMAALLLDLVRIKDPEKQADAADRAERRPYPQARSLFGGMPSWSLSIGSATERFDLALGLSRVNRKTETSASNKAGLSPMAENTGAEDGAATLEEIILTRAKAYLKEAGEPEPLVVDAVELAKLIDEGASPQIVSVRNGFHYLLGHIPGATNIPCELISDPQYFQTIDPEREVYVYCYTGHTGGRVSLALGLLGYRSRNMRFGINGWTTSQQAVSGHLENFDLRWGWDFPLVKSGAKGAQEHLSPPDAFGCFACHSDLTALAVATWKRKDAQRGPKEKRGKT